MTGLTADWRSLRHPYASDEATSSNINPDKTAKWFEDQVGDFQTQYDRIRIAFNTHGRTQNVMSEASNLRERLGRFMDDSDHLENLGGRLGRAMSSFDWDLASIEKI